MTEVKRERCAGITAEQAYQEDCLEYAYRTSANPDFQRRAEIMSRTFAAQTTVSEGADAPAQVAYRTVFEV